MGHRRARTAAVLVAAAALAAATVAPSSAQDTGTTSGLGSSGGATSVLRLALGSDALVLRLIGEDSATSNDTANGGPDALERVTPVQVASSLLPALGAVAQPTVETHTTSGEQSQSTPAVDLGSLLAGTAVPGLLSGTIDPVALRSVVDASGAASGASGAVRNLTVLGGLLSTGTADLSLGSTALVTDAGAIRGLQLDHLEVLNLGALLDALGISLTDLPLDTAIGLLDQLGLALPGGLSADALLALVNGLLDDTGAVRTQVSALQAQIDGLQAQLDPLIAQLSTATALVDSLTSQLSVQQALLAACVVPALCAPIQALVTSLTTQLAAATASVANLNTLIDGLQTQIDALLDQIDALLGTITAAVEQLLGIIDGVLDGLGDAALLSIDDLVVGITARADDTLASSVATIVGSVGDVQVGGVSLGGLAAPDLGAVSALADQVTGTLGGILGLIDPALSSLVDVGLLEQTASVTEADGITHAVAGITGLRATVTPPDVCAVLGRLGLQETLGSVLDSLGEAVPALPGPVGDILGAVGSTVTCTAAMATGGNTAAALVDGVASALTQPLTVEALSVSGTGAFTVPATPAAPGTPGAPGAPGQLPVTGGNAQLAILAVALGGVGFGLRRLLNRTA